MKTSVRRGVFETNSSSTHSLTLCSQNEYNKWKEGELVLNWRDKFITREEAIKELKENSWFQDHKSKYFDWNDRELVDETLSKYEFYTYDYYKNNCLEWFHDTYTTPGGETIVAFGQFGWNG